MTAGRKPKPTALKLIQGTYRSDRANLNEPKPKAGIPPCPKFLRGDARKQYRKTAKKLLKIGLMTELDDMALSMLYQAYVAIRGSIERHSPCRTKRRNPLG